MRPATSTSCLNTSGAPVWRMLALLLLFASALRSEEPRSADPHPAAGQRLKSGYTNVKFLTRAVKDGKELDVPYEADFWLPPGYESEPLRRYPVIYVLQNMDIPRRELAEWAGKGQFPAFVVVHLGGITAPLNRGENGVWSDSQGPSGTIFRTEFLAWVEKHFRCLPGPKGRVLVGCSKAGGAVMHLGLNYPELFAAVVSADGAMRLYDTGNNDADYYEKHRLRFLDALEHQGNAAQTLPALMLLGSMFGSGGEHDAYLNRLQSAGMHQLEFQDCRHHGHDCDAMTAECFPEVMATFYNGVGDFAPWKPMLSHRGGVYSQPIDVTPRLAEPGWAVRYTLDGSDPHRAGQPAPGPICVSDSCWLRVIGIAPDGQRQSRETLARFTIQPPLAATAPGPQPGLLLRCYEGAAGRAAVRLQEGEKQPIVEVHVSTLGLTRELLAQATGRDLAWVYTGTLTVPQTRIYDFEIDWIGGLYFPVADKPVKTIGRRAYGIATFSLALEKGAHSIQLLQSGGQANKDGSIPMQLQVKQSDGEFQPVPTEWFRH